MIMCDAAKLRPYRQKDGKKYISARNTVEKEKDSLSLNGYSSQNIYIDRTRKSEISSVRIITSNMRSSTVNHSLRSS